MPPSTCNTAVAGYCLLEETRGACVRMKLEDVGPVRLSKMLGRRETQELVKSRLTAGATVKTRPLAELSKASQLSWMERKAVPPLGRILPYCLNV